MLQVGNVTGLILRLPAVDTMLLGITAVGGRYIRIFCIDSCNSSMCHAHLWPSPLEKSDMTSYCLPMEKRIWQVTNCLHLSIVCCMQPDDNSGNGDLGWSATPPRNCQENALSLTTNHPDMVRKQCFFVPNGSSTVSLGIHTILAGHAASVRSLALQRVHAMCVHSLPEKRQRSPKNSYIACCFARTI